MRATLTIPPRARRGLAGIGGEQRPQPGQITTRAHQRLRLAAGLHAAGQQRRSGRRHQTEQEQADEQFDEGEAGLFHRPLHSNLSAAITWPPSPITSTLINWVPGSGPGLICRRHAQSRMPARSRP